MAYISLFCVAEVSLSCVLLIVHPKLLDPKPEVYRCSYGTVPRSLTMRCWDAVLETESPTRIPKELAAASYRDLET